MTGEPHMVARSARPLGWVRTNWQVLFNICLFLVFAAWVGWQTWHTWRENRMGFVEVSFAAQNLILVALVLIRIPHRVMDRNLLHQAVALIAFCSGAAFMGEAPTGGALSATVSGWIVFCANILGAVCLFNLGRSFGILIALRNVKTGGLYSLVRHPMYGTDILLRIGFLVSHLSVRTAVFLILSTACYVYRAILEEKFLSDQPEYREYMRRVPYRFVPGVC